MILYTAVFTAVAFAQTPPSAWDQKQPGVAAGQVDEFNIQSKAYGRTRKAWVYTPPGYARERGPYDLVVAFDGDEYRSDIPLPVILDNLLAQGKIRPTVAVLVDNSEARLEDLANHQKFAAFMGDEIMPWVQGKWNVNRDPARTIITGSSAGGLAAAYVAFRRPDLFGKVLSQSGAFWRGNEGASSPYEWLTGQFVNSPKLPLSFYLEVGSKETVKAVGVGPVFIEANRRMRDALLAKGYQLTYVEVPGGVHSPESWRLHLAAGLMALNR